MTKVTTKILSNGEKKIRRETQSLNRPGFSPVLLSTLQYKGNEKCHAERMAWHMITFCAINLF